jgi:hypothetical protein
VVSTLIEDWNAFLGGWTLPVWFAIAILGLLWVVMPVVVLRDGQSVGIRSMRWAAAAAVLPIAVLPTMIAVPTRYGSLVLLGGLVLPLLVLISYLIVRASMPTCLECGREQRRDWRFCPFHVVAQQEAVFAPQPWDVPAMTPGAWASPPPRPESWMTPGGGAPAAATGRTVGTLVVAEGSDRGTAFDVREAGVTIGRDEGCDVALADDAVSARHARIAVSDGRAQLIDLGSSNGTSINGRVADRAFLYDGDRITVGDTVLAYRESP